MHEKPEGELTLVPTVPAQRWAHDSHGVLFYRSCDMWFRVGTNLERYVRERKAFLLSS